MTYVVRAKGYRQASLDTLEELEAYLQAIGCQGLGPGDVQCWGTFLDGDGTKGTLNLQGDIAGISRSPYLHKLTKMPVKKLPKPNKPRKKVRSAPDSIHERLMRGESVAAYRPQ